ncbi:MAG: hypothetical protein ABI606_16320, partial [Rhodoferax sp.]
MYFTYPARNTIAHFLYTVLFNNYAIRIQQGRTKPLNENRTAIGRMERKQNDFKSVFDHKSSCLLGTGLKVNPIKVSGFFAVVFLVACTRA